MLLFFVISDVFTMSWRFNIQLQSQIVRVSVHWRQRLWFCFCADEWVIILTIYGENLFLPCCANIWPQLWWKKKLLRLWCDSNHYCVQIHRIKPGKRISNSNDAFLQPCPSCGSCLRHNSGVQSLQKLFPCCWSCGQKGWMALHGQISNSMGPPPERLL